MAWQGFLVAAREIARDGTFSGLSNAIPFADIERAFSIQPSRGMFATGDSKHGAIGN